MNDRKNITDALHKLNEDTDEPETPTGGPTPVTRPRKPTPAAPAPAPRRAPRREPEPGRTVTMNIALPQSLHRRLRHFVIDDPRPAREIVIDAIAEYLDNHEDDHR